MKNTVIIKGNRYGISIVLDKDIAFGQLLADLKSRLRSAEPFFDSEKQLAVSFEGRTLTNDELDQILSVIKDNSKLNIQYVVEDNSELETIFYDIIQTEKQSDQEREETDSSLEVELSEKKQSVCSNEGEVQTIKHSSESTGIFYRGTLRSGQTLEAEDSLVIVGDVNPGAKVIAGGNIVIIGTLYGSVIAGSKNKTDAFVMALCMDPIQIQIADCIARSTDCPIHNAKKKEAMIATVCNGQIYVESVSKAAIQDIHF